MRAIFYIALAFFGVCGGCEITDRGVSNRDQNVIVNAHNRARLMVAQGRLKNQPKAGNMLRMFWDDKLAREAQKIANTCRFSHVKVSDRRWSVGQNLYTSWSSNAQSPNWNAAVDSWFNEHKFYKYGTGFSMKTGHYTQVVWAKTRYVGCGHTLFLSPRTGFRYQHLYVCNYGPAGNYHGQKPYELGNGCYNLC